MSFRVLANAGDAYFRIVDQEPESGIYPVIKVSDITEPRERYVSDVLDALDSEVDENPGRMNVGFVAGDRRRGGASDLGIVIGKERVKVTGGRMRQRSIRHERARRDGWIAVDFTPQDFDVGTVA